MVARATEVSAVGPRLAYVPGIDGTGELLFGTRDRLASRFALTCLRYEGTRAEGAKLYDRLADSILEALPTGPTLLLAESFGGAVALTIALRAPERVRGLCLVNTFARYPRRARIRLGAALAPWTPRGALELGRRTLAAPLFFRPRRDEGLERAFRRLPAGFRGGGYPARLAAIRDLDLVPALGRITVPCALFASDSDRVVPSRHTMAELARELPDADLVELARAGHLVLPLDEEPWVERLVALDERAASRNLP